MIKLKVKETIYDVPTNFDELTWQHFVKIHSVQGRPILERIHVISNIPIDDLLEFSLEDFGKLCEIIGFTDVLDIVQYYGGLEIDLNVGKESYGDLEKARQEINQSGSWIKAANKVGLIYLKEDISELHLPLAIAKIRPVFDKINEFLEKYRKLFEGEVEAEEQMAGVEVLSKFGSFPTIDRLAIAYGKTHDEVLAMPAEIVYTKLLYDLESSEYQEKLHKIKSAIK
jgi:hypothetical protein